MTRPIPASVASALAALWRLPPAHPNDLFEAPAFIRLCTACQDSYANTGWDQTLKFALLYALRSLSAPCAQNSADEASSTVAEATAALDRAFLREAFVRTHLCPLDLASDLPPLTFGAATLRRFSADELHRLFDWAQLRRHYPSGLPDLGEFAQFQWLVVHETVGAAPSASERALPGLETILSALDPAHIVPHASRLPAPVEQALFFLLLAPWEDWAEIPGIDWRGFTIPWVYSRCDDPFVRPALPRSARSLSWEPRININRYGEEVEWETPVELPLRDEAAQLADVLTDPAWINLQNALASPLFETPVVHFLVRAFLGDGIDEFLAHITMLEAALGAQSDYGHGPKSKTSPRRNLKPTERMMARVNGLLESSEAGTKYKHLFDLRSRFLHGRPLQSISVEDRVEARRLARRVAGELARVAITLPKDISRDDWLDALIDRGASGA